MNFIKNSYVCGLSSILTERQNMVPYLIIHSNICIYKRVCKPLIERKFILKIFSQNVINNRRPSLLASEMIDIGSNRWTGHAVLIPCQPLLYIYFPMTWEKERLILDKLKQQSLGQHACMHALIFCNYSSEYKRNGSIPSPLLLLTCVCFLLSQLTFFVVTSRSISLL